MTATTFNLTIEQGIPFIQEFLVRETADTLKNLTGFSGRMQFRLNHSSSNVELSATTVNGKIIIDTVNSICKISLSEADTSLLSYSKYVYDLELINASGIPLRLVEGTIKVNPEVTR